MRLFSIFAYNLVRTLNQTNNKGDRKEKVIRQTLLDLTCKSPTLFEQKNEYYSRIFFKLCVSCLW